MLIFKPYSNLILFISGSSLPFHPQLCFAHGLHLGVQDFLYEKLDTVELPIDDDDNIDIVEISDGLFEVVEQAPLERAISNTLHLRDLVKKVRQAMQYFQNSPTRREVFLEKHVQKDKNGKTLGPVTDVKTRWSSTFHMLERFCVIQKGLEMALMEAKSNIRFSVSEINDIKDLMKSLRCVSVALEKIGARSANLLLADSMISFVLNELERYGEMGRSLFMAILKRVNQRRSVASSALQLLQNNFSNKLHPQLIVHSDEDIDQFILSTWNRIKGDDSFNSHESPIIFEEDREDDLEDSMEKRASQYAEEPSNKTQPLVDATIEAELYELRMLQRRGPKCEELLTYLSSIQPTSVECERSFSVAGRMCNKINSSLGDEAIFALGLVYSVLSAEEKKEEEEAAKIQEQEKCGVSKSTAK